MPSCHSLFLSLQLPLGPLWCFAVVSQQGGCNQLCSCHKECVKHIVDSAVKLLWKLLAQETSSVVISDN